MILIIILILYWVNHDTPKVIEYRNYYARSDGRGNWKYYDNVTNKQIGYRDKGMAYIRWFDEE